MTTVIKETHIQGCISRRLSHHWKRKGRGLEKEKKKRGETELFRVMRLERVHTKIGVCGFSSQRLVAGDFDDVKKEIKMRW